MEEPLFYALGIALVLVALVISFIGMRSEGFPPSGALLRVGALGAVLLVAATATAAVVLAREEQRHREEEAAVEQEATEEDAAEAEAEEDADATEEPPPADEGRGLFVDNCGVCHTLADAGTTGTAAPDLDERAAGRDPAFVRETVLDPPPGMPELAGQFDDGQLDALAEYVAAAAGD